MPKITGPFDGQVYIDLTSSSANPISPSSIKIKWNAAHPDNPQKYLNGLWYFNNLHQPDTENINCDNWFSKDDHIRIYLVVHHSPGKKLFKINSNVILTVDDIAEILKNVIHNHENVVVNLIACSAGAGDPKDYLHTPDKSAASAIHMKLRDIMQRDIPVVARNLVTYIAGNTGRKMTSRVSLSYEEAKLGKDILSKQPLSKVVFYEENGQQVRQDAYEASIDKYLDRWKNYVADDISLIFLNDKEKKRLEHWLGDLNKLNELSPDDIYNQLKQAVDDPELKKKNLFSFFAITKTVSAILQEYIKTYERFKNPDPSTILPKINVKPLK